MAGAHSLLRLKPAMLNEWRRIKGLRQIGGEGKAQQNAKSIKCLGVKAASRGTICFFLVEDFSVQRARAEFTYKAEVESAPGRDQMSCLRH